MTCIFSGWAFLEQDNQASQKIGLLLKSDTNTFVFSTISQERKDVAGYFTNNFPALHKYTGFQITLDKTSFGIPSGKYQVGLCILQKGEIVGFQQVSQQIEF